MSASRTVATVIALAGMLCAAPALGAINDPYFNPGLTPPDPTVDDNGGVTWGGWQPLVLGQAYDLNPGATIYLGLENLYLDPSWTKTVTLEYEAVQGVAPGDSRAGYPPNSGQMAGPWDDLTHGFSGPTGRHLVVGTIAPQPSWEWVCITNTDNELRRITVFTFTSECVPEPGAIGLLMTAGLVAARRRRA